ncbi:hypothetical protein [Streptomyces sp. NRRL B-1347]|uniref:hypothetical protein n=1 Tax=Streptomyces sp. NRRL B-1347 TaxID=1476877 RepID=UPI0004CA29DE|nr:hypothetical protein [Streptomyces sp. NRRL B-1347]
MPLQTDVCDPWPIDLTCCDLSDDTSPETIERWQKVASILLFRLSGRRLGPSCPVTVRPCRRQCLEALPWLTPYWGAVGPWIPYLSDGVWRNASVCGCRGDCSCEELCEIRLDGPVYDIVSVQEGPETLPDTAYRVDGSGTLLRTDGECWPDCQDMAAAEGEEDTLTVTYRTGLPLDEAAVAAVSALTCHLIKGCGTGACGCKANRNLTRLNRQGTEYEFADPTLVYSEGRTGIPDVDLWLVTVNPHRLASPSRVYSPDFPRPRLVR